MAAESGSASLSATVELTINGRQLKLDLTVPPGNAPASAMLPTFRSMTDQLVAIAEKQVQEKGQSISCRKGCGACCRQLVPISEIEAHRLATLVSEMPEPKQAQIRARFADACARLADSRILEVLESIGRVRPEHMTSVGLSYFRHGIACPFLEDESCSIHAERPLACREYLVVTPAERCAKPGAEDIECVSLPAELSRAIRIFRADKRSHENSWVPLILALEWSQAHPAQAPPRPGKQWVQELFARLAQLPSGQPPL